jgi:hypothetical protein
MRAENLAVLDRITLSKLEDRLDKHTREQVPVDRWTAFSWSVSRHHMFVRCKRLYYLNYYGARRVREANDQVVSAVWWLKQVIGITTWIGTVIHHAAALAVTAYRDRCEIDPQCLVEQAVTYFRDGVSASRRGAKHDGAWVVLFPHVYPGEMAQLGRAEAEECVVELAHTLLKSEAYNFIKSLPPRAICEVDEPFQSFTLPGVPLLDKVKVFAIPDVLLREGGAIHIVDWKTGDVEAPGLREQAGVYRLYAHHRYGLAGEFIHAHFAALGGAGEMIEAPGGTPSVEEARAMIHNSIRSMVEHMSELEYNTVSIKDFPRTDDLSLCQRCGFKRACWRHEETDG